MLDIKTPPVAVDIIIRFPDGSGVEKLVLIERKNSPYGWALPGGFVDYGEKLEEAAIREAREETCLEIEIEYLLGAYSEPSRDPRGHTVSIVYVATGSGAPKAADDAANLQLFAKDELPEILAFDHKDILHDFFDRSQF